MESCRIFNKLTQRKCLDYYPKKDNLGMGLSIAQLNPNQEFIRGWSMALRGLTLHSIIFLHFKNIIKKLKNNDDLHTIAIKVKKCMLIHIPTHD